MRVLICSATPWDVPSFYRTTGPLLADAAFDVVFPLSAAALTWVDVARADLVSFARPYSELDLINIRFCKAAGVGVWVDYDDDLLNVPLDNPSFTMFSRPGVAKTVKAAVDAADIVTFSTSAIKKNVGGGKGTVIANALPPERLLPPATNCSSAVSAYWRGSAAHAMDVSVFADAIAAALTSANASFTSYGPVPWQIAHSPQFKAKFDVVGEQSIVEFFRDLRAANHGVCVVPLVDTPFNRAKSNIAWLEATAVGSITVAPALPEFDRPGVLQYSNSSELETQLAAALRMSQSDRQQLWERSMAAAKEITAAAREARRRVLTTWQ